MVFSGDGGGVIGVPWSIRISKYRKRADEYILVHVSKVPKGLHIPKFPRISCRPRFFPLKSMLEGSKPYRDFFYSFSHTLHTTTPTDTDTDTNNQQHQPTIPNPL